METAQIIEIVLEVLAFIGGSAVVSAVIPTKAKQYLPILSQILELLAANFWNAKNADEKK